MNNIGFGYVYIMNKNNEFLKIGELNNSNKNLTLNSGIKSVDNFNIKFLNYIENTQPLNYYNSFDIIKSDDIIGIIFDKLKWRRCNGYLVLQISNKGFRYICYLHDIINHSANSFGTSYNLVKKDYIVQQFIKKISILDKIIDYSIFPQLKIPINHISDIDNHFGI